MNQKLRVHDLKLIEGGGAAKIFDDVRFGPQSDCSPGFTEWRGARIARRVAGRPGANGPMSPVPPTWGAGSSKAEGQRGPFAGTSAAVQTTAAARLQTAALIDQALQHTVSGHPGPSVAGPVLTDGVVGALLTSAHLNSNSNSGAHATRLNSDGSR